MEKNKIAECATKKDKHGRFIHLEDVEKYLHDLNQGGYATEDMEEKIKIWNKKLTHDIARGDFSVFRDDISPEDKARMSKEARELLRSKGIIKAIEDL